MKPVAIVNPDSGARDARRVWPALLDALGPRAAPIETWWTARPGHPEELGAAARRMGFDRVVVAGGDGTLSGVLNGLWREPEGRMPVLGMVPFGTGSDYVRNFNLGESLLEKLSCALGEAAIPVSLGGCRLQGLDGRPKERVFAMALGAGFDANVIARFRSRRTIRRGWAAYALSGLRELRDLRSYRFEGEMEGEPVQWNGPIFVAGIGRFFGRAMMAAPGASPVRPAFQVIRGEELGRLALARLLCEVYWGRHVRHPLIAAHFASKLTLRSTPQALVEADGEPIGLTPLTLEIYPKAFCFAARGIRS